MKINKNFSLILIGQIISLFGNTIQRFALSLYVLDITGSAAIYGNILALSIVPYIILAPIAGNIADNYNKKRMMVILDILAGILMVVCLGLFMLKVESLFLIGTVMILLSSISACYGPVVTSSIPRIVDKDYLQKANSYVSQVGSWSIILGPILGGMLYGFLGIKIILLLNGLSFIISAILEMFITIPEDKNKTRKSLNIIKSYSHMNHTFNILRKNYKVVLGIILSYCLYNISIVPINSILLPSIVNLEFGLSSQTYGIIESIIASGMLFSGISINAFPKLFKFKTHYKWNYLMPLSMIVMGLTLLISKNLGVSTFSITMGGFVIMFCLGIGNIITLTHIQTSVPPEILGSVSALSTAVATGSVPIGQVAFGHLMQSSLHTGNLLIGCGMIALLVCNYVKYNIKRDGVLN